MEVVKRPCRVDRIAAEDVDSAPVGMQAHGMKVHRSTNAAVALTSAGASGES